MNREQRRKYERQIKKVKYASICPVCGLKARFISTRKTGDETSLICEACGQVVRSGPDITKSVPPGIVLPMELDKLDMMIEALKASEQKQAEDEATQEIVETETPDEDEPEWQESLF